MYKDNIISSPVGDAGVGEVGEDRRKNIYILIILSCRQA